MQADAADAHTSDHQPVGKTAKGLKGKPSKAKSGGASQPAAAAEAAAADILEDSGKLKVAGLLAVMARLALNDPDVSGMLCVMMS